MGVGGVRIRADQHYKGVRCKVISIMREGVNSYMGTFKGYVIQWGWAVYGSGQISITKVYNQMLLVL